MNDTTTANESTKAIVDEFCVLAELTRTVQETAINLVKQLGRHYWQDLVFDIELSDERQDYITANPGVMLPITHKGDPIRHADLCEQLSKGKQPWFVSVYALATLKFDDANTYTLEDVNFDTLDQTQAAMFEVLRTAMVIKAPTALDRGIALLEHVTGTKARKVTKKVAKKVTKKISRKR